MPRLEGVRPALVVCVEYDGKESSVIAEAPGEYLDEEEVVVAVKQLDRWANKKHRLKALREARTEEGRKYGLLGELVYSEQLDCSKSHLLILKRSYLQDFVCSARNEAQPGRGSGQDKVEKEGAGKNKEKKVKPKQPKPSFVMLPRSEDSAEKGDENSAQKGGKKTGKRSRRPSSRVVQNAQQGQ